jgi:thioredoxin-dependent peroxiredoxin
MPRPKVGDQAPEFALPGTGEQTYRLSDYRGSRVILAFYPGDFTVVCTRQFCSYRDNADRLAGLGAEVLGISPQSVSSHERFAKHHRLTVPLLADTEKRAARAYGVLAGPIVRRSIFILDEEAVIRHRKVTLAGLSYESVDDLERAMAAIG